MANLRVCDGECSREQLSQSQVATVVQQAVNEAMMQGVPGATIAVTDRVGNALAVFEMGSAPQTVTIGSNPNSVVFPGNGLEDVPGGANIGSADVTGASLAAPISARFAALSKAGTAAYLSTQGNAFTTRTASQIIQQNFNPGEANQAGGPLFGVQFSQLPCGDIARKASFVVAAQGRAGPKRLPLGFSGDPGGVPLYINGDMVGAVGVEVDGVYTVDPATMDDDNAVEELIALAAQRSFEPSKDREARLITVIGKFLRYVDFETPGPPQASQPLSSLVSSVTGATPVDITTLLGAPGFYQASDGILAGTRFLDAASGYALVPANPGYFNQGQRTRILVNPDGTPFLGQNLVDPAIDPNVLQPVVGAVNNPRDSLSPPPASNGGLTAMEAGIIASKGIEVAQQARAQIRRGIGGPGLPFMQVNVSVVDLAGNLLAFVGTTDAPVFGTTVAIQKARTAAFISRPPNGADPNMPTSAADDMMADVEPADPLGLGVNFQVQSIGQYVQDVRAFIPDPTALANGIAFSDRSGGNLSRPFYPDGINGMGNNGPFSRPISSWSPFNTGLQLDLILDRLLIGLLLDPTVTACTGSTLLEVRGGIQIFPGSVPIFKDGRLVGGMGVSGDGVDQDDLVAFEGVKRGGRALGGNGIGGPGMIGNAPPEIRSDTINPRPPFLTDDNGNLRYVNCPPAPFLNDNSQNVCEGT